MISVRGGDIDLNPDEWIKAIYSPGLVVSAIGHLGALIVGLFLVSANPSQAPRPEATVVEVVTSDEMPRFEGTPSTLRSSGSETPSPANGKNSLTQAPPPQSRPQPQQETQQRPTPPRETNEAPASRPPAPEATQAELVRAEKTEPEKQNQSSEAQPVASQPAEQTATAARPFIAGTATTTDAPRVTMFSKRPGLRRAFS